MNMVARFHRNVALSCPHAPLLAPQSLILSQPPQQHMSLSDALVTMATAIDPFIHIDLPAPEAPAPGIGVGTGLAVPVPWHVGCNDSMVQLDTTPVPMDAQSGFSLGACLASCLAAACLCKQVLRKPLTPLEVSAWNLRQGHDADIGPSELCPVDVGRVLLIGAGGVGSSLAYWLRQSGFRGDWQVVDRDLAELHNTNRSLGLVAADAGWPGREPRSKASAAAELMGCTPIPLWYDELDQETLRPDLVLPLANERAVRSAIAMRGEPVILHATTSLTWEAQLHRHIAGKDDCIMCRMPSRYGAVKLACSTVPLVGSGVPTDAALPFLSATAGFLVLNGLYRLMAGELGQGEHNLWRVMFNTPNRLVSSARCRCQESCVWILPERVRRKVSAGHRWAYLDPASDGQKKATS
ncbi:MAG: ThiF family adenylyltransferase [Phycisphaerae bacterium]|jgi:hypothetical protein